MPIAGYSISPSDPETDFIVYDARFAHLRFAAQQRYNWATKVA